MIKVKTHAWKWDPPNADSSCFWGRSGTREVLSGLSGWFVFGHSCGAVGAQVFLAWFSVLLWTPEIFHNEKCFWLLKMVFFNMTLRKLQQWQICRYVSMAKKKKERKTFWDVLLILESWCETAVNFWKCGLSDCCNHWRNSLIVKYKIPDSQTT